MRFKSVTASVLACRLFINRAVTCPWSIYEYMTVTHVISRAREGRF